MISERKISMYDPYAAGGKAYYNAAKSGFNFEEDFMENNIRCIPMIVRFKLDAIGIKLKLAEWSKFKVEERKSLTEKSCVTPEEIKSYRDEVRQLVRRRAGTEPTMLSVEDNPAWFDMSDIHYELQEQAKEYNWEISVEQWRSLTNLQRFALLKLSKPGHENKNFSKAMKEFCLA